MNNLKTNRSVELYVILTILSMLTPVITGIVLFNRMISGMQWWLADTWFSGVLAKFLAPFIIVGILYIAYTVYKIVLFYGVFKDVGIICEKYRIGGLILPYPLVWFLSGITMNIFYVIWSWMMGKRLKDASDLCQKPIKGTPESHLIFAVVESLPVFAGILFVTIANIWKPGLRFYAVFLIVYFITYISSFIGIFNMAGFIRDVNQLARVYNGQAGAVDDGYGVLPQKNMQQDDKVTISAREWIPDAGNSWKPDAISSGGIMEGCKGVYEGAQIPVEEEVVIGRDEMSCNVVINVPEVSRKHCGIRYNPDCSYTVVDYSSNGTYYKNGQPFPKNTPVICGAGTIIVIARSGNEFILR